MLSHENDKKTALCAKIRLIKFSLHYCHTRTASLFFLSFFLLFLYVKTFVYIILSHPFNTHKKRTKFIQLHCEVKWGLQRSYPQYTLHDQTTMTTKSWLTMNRMCKSILGAQRCMIASGSLNVMREIVFVAPTGENWNFFAGCVRRCSIWIIETTFVWVKVVEVIYQIIKWTMKTRLRWVRIPSENKFSPENRSRRLKSSKANNNTIIIGILVGIIGISQVN